MSNSVSRAQAARNLTACTALAEAIRATTGYQTTSEQDRQILASFTARLRHAGLRITEVGPTYVHDDTVHRVDTAPAEPAPADDLADLLAEAQRIRTRSGRTAEVVGLLLDRLEQPLLPPPDDGRGPRLVPRRDPHLCWRIHPDSAGACQLPDGHDLPQVDSEDGVYVCPRCGQTRTADRPSILAVECPDCGTEEAPTPVDRPDPTRVTSHGP